MQASGGQGLGLDCTYSYLLRAEEHISLFVAYFGHGNILMQALKVVLLKLMCSRLVD
jgi:hypothetical protein